MALALFIGSFAVGYGPSSDLFNQISVYWLHHYDAKWTPAANVEIFRHVLPLTIAISCVSALAGARAHRTGLNWRWRIGIAGLVSGIFSAIAMFLASALVIQPVGTLIFLASPALISYGILRAWRRCRVTSPGDAHPLASTIP